MNIQQFRYICEVAAHDLKISKVAEVLHTSQPNVSTQIKLLEDELGLTIFVRQRRRLVSITPAGIRVIERAQRILAEINEIKLIGGEQEHDRSGTLLIAASHTQARFRLPAVLRTFRDQYPDVHINIRPESGRAIQDALNAGTADIGILSQCRGGGSDLVYIPFKTYQRVLLVNIGHPLLQVEVPTLAEIMKYPVVINEPSQTAELILRLIGENGSPGPALIKTTNVDMVKAYVEHGVGISIVPDIVFDEVRDAGLAIVQLKHIFPTTTTYLAINRRHHLRRYAFDFIQTMAPAITRDVVEQAMSAPRDRTEEEAPRA